MLELCRYPAKVGSTCASPNPTESTLATARLCQRVTKGPQSSAAGIAMAYKRIEAASRTTERSRAAVIAQFLGAVRSK